MIDFNSNMGIVAVVYNRNFKGYGYIKDDLMQCGYLGLWKACKKFDESRKTKFTTFAMICIKNEMLMYLTRKEKPHMNNVELTDIVEEQEFEQYNGEDIAESVYCDLVVKNIKKQCRHPEIIQLLLDGYTLKEVADIVGMNNMYICRAMKRKIKKSTFLENEHII